jgi:hypothetical protein
MRNLDRLYFFEIVDILSRCNLQKFVKIFFCKCCTGAPSPVKTNMRVSYCCCESVMESTADANCTQTTSTQSKKIIVSVGGLVSFFQFSSISISNNIKYQIEFSTNCAGA